MADRMIYKAISQTMADIGVVGKDDVNKSQGFKYRGIDAVMNALNPAMIKNGIFVVPEVLEQTREERITNKGNNLIYSICKVKYTFFAEDGSSVQAVVIGEGMDSGDKATNKAMSIALKYACFQIFCIPTEEMKDPDAECHDVAPKDSDSESAKKEAKKADNPKIRKADVNAIRSLMKRKGLQDESSITGYFEVEKFEDMNFEQFNKAMRLIEKYPDAKKSAS